jgi:hypothetical protein
MIRATRPRRRPARRRREGHLRVPKAQMRVGGERFELPTLGGKSQNVLWTLKQYPQVPALPATSIC